MSKFKESWISLRIRRGENSDYKINKEIRNRNWRKDSFRLSKPYKKLRIGFEWIYLEINKLKLLARKEYKKKMIHSKMMNSSIGLSSTKNNKKLNKISNKNNKPKSSPLRISGSLKNNSEVSCKIWSSYRNKSNKQMEHNSIKNRNKIKRTISMFSWNKIIKIYSKNS